MDYPELCATLKRELGAASVFDKRFPVLGAGDAESASLVIWAHDGVFAVGGVDRGEFTTVHEFATESAACEYVLDALRRNATIPPETDAERRASRAVTGHYTATLLEQFGAPE
ncbi:hypothetical protein AB1K54_15535 [Microbacterium sp. BWT-B31]|uniref:hypothetical protein n=1 Tax=Microbacterium sp. BWT-B31 TaxID=3232072 RepID=UPI003527ACA1